MVVQDPQIRRERKRETVGIKRSKVHDGRDGEVVQAAACF